MSDLAIKVERLSKQYRLGQRERYKSLRDVLANPFKRSPKAETIWALRDVSFEIKRGEVVGVIGRNGAGKSTLLKILSQITEPTTGTAEIHGRVGSLLEVGTGFHPELTGRENIFLNGAILGMRKHEIARKFDEIVAFAEVEKFIDTPVKHYSSGMQMRLAFAVAAHLEPEILLVDEVLAVGDAAFQKKCLGKMSAVAKQGRTILFVSHNIPAVTSLCQRGLLLASGRLDWMGPATEAAERYLAEGHGLRTCFVDLTDNHSRHGTGELRLLRFWVENQLGDPVTGVATSASCRLAVAYESVDGQPRRDVAMSIHINTIFGAPVSLINTYMLNQDFACAPPRGVIRFEIPRLPLSTGRYTVDLNLATHAGHSYSDFIRSAAEFDVLDGDFYGTGRPGNPGAPVLIDGRWTLEPSA